MTPESAKQAAFKAIDDYGPGKFSHFISLRPYGEDRVACSDLYMPLLVTPDFQDAVTRLEGPVGDLGQTHG